MSFRGLDYLDIAHKLKIEADNLLKITNIETILQRYGLVLKFGSYALDLMVWPDLDLYLEANKWPFPRPLLANLCHDLGLLDNLTSLKIETALFNEKPFLPQGIYIGLKLQYGHWKLPWKFDIWILDKPQVDEKRQWLTKTLAKLTPSNKAFILEQKHRFITLKGRTPSFSSFYLYQAILDKGLTHPKEIRDYLHHHGILLPETDFSATPW